MKNHKNKQNPPLKLQPWASAQACAPCSRLVKRAELRPAQSVLGLLLPNLICRRVS